MTQQAPDVTLDGELHRASLLMRQGRAGEAAQLCDQLLSEHPDETQLLRLRSNVAAACGSLIEAVRFAAVAVETAPDDAGAHVDHARHLMALGDKAEALVATDRAAALEPDIPVLNDAIGSLYAFCDEQDRALIFAGRAVAAAPDNATFRSNLAMIQRMLGEFEAAEANFDCVIAQDPQQYRAYFARADLKRWSEAENHVDEIRQQLAMGVQDWRGEAAMHFALAKELEDIGDRKTSFASLKSGCDLQRANMRYDVAGDVAAIDSIIAQQDKETLGQLGDGNPSREPIFIIGLPRTGTTLVDRIIGSHSEVFSAGELNNFSLQMVAQVRKQLPSAKTKLDFIKHSTSLDMAALGRDYVASTRPRTGATAHFTDKLPLNYLYAGLISRALPGAKLVLLERHPVDACFAMYRTQFVGIYPFSYDLNDLAEYYLAYARLVDHWKRTLGARLYCVCYEDLVARQEEETCALIKYCGLHWEDACLDFHRNAAPSSTASAVQVRQPIYSSSIGRWKHFEEELEPLISALKAGGVDLG